MINIPKNQGKRSETHYSKNHCCKNLKRWN